MLALVPAPKWCGSCSGGNGSCWTTPLSCWRYYIIRGVFVRNLDRETDRDRLSGGVRLLIATRGGGAGFGCFRPLA